MSELFQPFEVRFPQGEIVALNEKPPGLLERIWRRLFRPSSHCSECGAFIPKKARLRGARSCRRCLFGETERPAPPPPMRPRPLEMPTAGPGERIYW